ncbi:hypothetical protein [Azospirillum rugosum]|uniref:Imelysin n=1 Tax=Azospirillum rugosum TaxID=416170 RepID=A0ABS4SEL0_9PROT|nr:hypothetical protein [Azospirillum rugosum]MBP2291015.1 hypothetical protein [Azospirillum rugosum]MDQ0524921.1 hypothetical protein [Azospirillum rugosum]
MTRKHGTSPSRRSLLACASAAALAATSPARAASTPGGIDLSGDEALVTLWVRFVELSAQYVEAKAKVKEAVNRLPQWARWQSASWGGFTGEPEWTDEMLRDLAIPESVGRRPNFKGLEDLAAETMKEAYRPYTKNGSAAGASLLCLLDKAQLARGELPVDAIYHEPEPSAARDLNERRWAAYRRRHDEQRAEEDKAGVTAANEVADQLSNALHDVKWEIIDSNANTAAGTIIKLRVLAFQKTEEGALQPDEMDSEDRAIVGLARQIERIFPDIAAVLPLDPITSKILGGAA